ncbi:uncharacterized protein JCM6883_006195 [Sporobolomyces salmoneus]|uniref:uncharacterized protein n=1 Tax=Sporobolomyces salmoneus TaxID=183962 RepID=UPI00317C1653
MPAIRSIAAIAALSLLPQLGLAQEVLDNSTSTDSTVSSSQYWHERYHGLLSMAAYSDDPTTICTQQTFTQAALLKSFPESTEAPWTLIQQFGPTASGASGFNVIIPEMDKVVVVFKGMFGWESTFNDSTADIGTALNLGPRCTEVEGGCTAHAGALQAYLEVKEATNDWELVKYYVNTTGHQWSVTGHGFGGAMALIASIDLGWRNLCHWSHSHGAPRVFNPAAADLYNSLFQGEAGQRTVANDDAIPGYIPESANYTHTLQGFHVYGENVTYGMNFDICNTATDANCLGGQNVSDHLFYYTPIGECGNPNKQNVTQQEAYESTASEAFYATATSTFVPPTSTPEPSSTSASEAVTTGAGAAASGVANAATGSNNTSGALKLVGTGFAGLVATTLGFVILA